MISRIRSALCLATRWSLSGDAARDPLVAGNSPGSNGGRLVAAQRAEPKTLNPVFAVDNPFREIIGETEGRDWP